MFDNPQGYNELLQYLTLFLLIVIFSMIYFMNTNTDKIENDIANLELNCPEPILTDSEGNECPKCADCPDCPDCNDPNNPNNIPIQNCPTVNCPTVNDIVSGIFPGRNSGITSSGRYFDVQANENYELMPSYDFYEPSNAFPSDSILTASDSLLQGNVNVPLNQIANSQGFSLLNTSLPTRIDSRIDIERMDMASSGENTGPSTFGTGTQRITGEQSRNSAGRTSADQELIEGGSSQQRGTSQLNPDGETYLSSNEQRRSELAGNP